MLFFVNLCFNFDLIWRELNKFKLYNKKDLTKFIDEKKRDKLYIIL